MKTFESSFVRNIVHKDTHLTALKFNLVRLLMNMDKNNTHKYSRPCMIRTEGKMR